MDLYAHHYLEATHKQSKLKSSLNDITKATNPMARMSHLMHWSVVNNPDVFKNEPTA